MENLNLTIAAAVGAAAVIGLLAGYLFGRSRSGAAERESATQQARADELAKQLSQKDIEIQRLNANDADKQRSLSDSIAARTRAETEFADARREIDILKAEAAEERKRISDILAENTEFSKQNAELKANYEAALRSIRDQEKFIVEANEKLRESFESLSSEALRKNTTSFMEIAKQTLESQARSSRNELELRKEAIDQMIQPLGETLTKFDQKLGEIELKREGAYSQMETLLGEMKGTTENLAAGTSDLVSALKTSYIRGRYGEIGLRRIVEAAGMSQFCDFTEQESVRTERGRLRPDMTVNLPGGRQLIIDSKAPLEAYTNAFSTDIEDEKIEYMKKHAKAVRGHLIDLSGKAYWEQFSEAPDFVILYMQIESSFGAALMYDHQLIEDGINRNVVLATPSTLITMLRTIGFVWQQQRIATDIGEMHAAGVELYNRTATLFEHFAEMGRGLKRSVETYNKAVGSLETRFVPQLARLKEIGGTKANKKFPEFSPIETSVREVDTARQLMAEGDAEYLSEMLEANEGDG